jgi:hypothetical protein
MSADITVRAALPAEVQQALSLMESPEFSRPCRPAMRPLALALLRLGASRPSKTADTDSMASRQSDDGDDNSPKSPRRRARIYEPSLN